MGNWMEFREVCRVRVGHRDRRGRAELFVGRMCAPEELDVYCEQCRFNYFSLEGNPSCDDPLTCEHASVPLAHVENYRRWALGRGVAVVAS